jgi:signal peptidase II
MNILRMRVATVIGVLLLVGCDHGSKILAQRALEHRPPHTLLRGIFDLDYVENRDAGFGLLRAVPERFRTPLLTSVQLVSGLAFLALGLRKGARRITSLCLVLVSAGALGNGLDRLFRGYVIDFLHLHHWPVFNAADIYITAAAILLVISSRFAGGGRQSPRDHQGSSPSSSANAA